LHFKRRQKDSTPNIFCGSLGISFFASRDVGRAKTFYIWISADPTEAGATLVVVAVVVYLKVLSISLPAVA